MNLSPVILQSLDETTMRVPEVADPAYKFDNPREILVQGETMESL